MREEKRRRWRFGVIKSCRRSEGDEIRWTTSINCLGRSYQGLSRGKIAGMIATATATICIGLSYLPNIFQTLAHGRVDMSSIVK